ncbi:hypothetical protein BGX24_002822 [Mortierella sp. AD032]|nr:hypothetical protein BGX24_002822 [Mortierella sp. AD032]
MYPNQAGRVLDKENDIVTEGNAGRTGGPTAGGPVNLVKQTSLIGNRTPSKQMNNPSGAKTPMQQGKVLNLGMNSPSAQGVLRQKTNYQLPPTAATIDNNNSSTTNTNQKKKSGLARTFSTVLESNNNNNSSTTPSTPVKTESRRLSLTKRGSAKTRLVVHKDEPTPTTATTASEAPIKTNLGPTQNIKTESVGGGAGGTSTSHRPVIRPAKAPLESATTLLSIERSLESEDKVIVGQAKAETKRRALTNQEDKFEIEYCPPPVEEQPYEPDLNDIGVINQDILKTVPPPLAYQIQTMDDSEPALPSLELAPTERPSRSLSPSWSDLSDNETDIPVARMTLTADGHLDLTWSDDDDHDENDGSPHPIGSISHHSLSGNISSGRRFRIKDLPNEEKFRPPFDGFMFDLDTASSEGSLSEDDDDIFGSTGGSFGAAATGVDKDREVAHEQVDDFNKAFGLDDLGDESKVQAPFSEFSFEL